MNKKKYLPLFKIKKTLGRSIVILRMTEVWRLLSIQRHKFLKLVPVSFFLFFGTLKPVGGKQDVIFVFDDNIKEKDSTKTIINLRQFSFSHQKITQNDKILSYQKLTDRHKFLEKYKINFDNENALLVDVYYINPFEISLIINEDMKYILNHTSFQLINLKDTTKILKEFEIQYGEPAKIIISPNKQNFITYNYKNGIQYWNKKQTNPIKKISNICSGQIMFFPNGDKLFFEESENIWKIVKLDSFEEVCKIIIENENIIFITPDLYSFETNSNSLYLVNGMNSIDIKKTKNKMRRFDIIIEKLGLSPLPSNLIPILQK